MQLKEKVAGAIFGAAIGDAMGHPTEFIDSFESIRQKYGALGVTGYELYWEQDGIRFAPYTDDTQMAEIVCQCLLQSLHEGEDLDTCMNRMGKGFVEWAHKPQGGHRAPGNACLSGCKAYENGAHWSEAGGATAGGCGSVMRAYPFGLLMTDEPERAERWAVAHSKLTHGDPIALAACAAMVRGMIASLAEDPVDSVVAEMVGAAGRYSSKTADMIQQAADEAQAGVAVEVSLDRLRGWAAHEAIAAATYVFVRHPDNPKEAILEGANTPGDSDSIATLAGALTGARTGIKAIPERWVWEIERSEAFIDLAESIAHKA